MIARRLRPAVAGLAVGVVVLAAPAAASAGLVSGILDRVQATLGEALGKPGGGAPPPAAPDQAPRAASQATPGGIAPASPGDSTSGLAATPSVTSGGPVGLSSTNPHGQGQDLAVALAGNELLAVGRATGSQYASGRYHGQVVAASLLGTDLPVAAVSTDEGESADSPIQALDDALAQLCSASGNNVCLDALVVHSKTTSRGSENHFSVLDANVGDGAVLETSVLSSNGNISQGGGCQTAHGDSAVANPSLLGGAVTADALESTSDSTACNDGTKAASGSGRVADLNGSSLLGLAGLGCDETQPNQAISVLGLITGACNGDVTVDPPASSSNAHDALELNILPQLADLLNAALAGFTGGSAESLAVAPSRSGPKPPPCASPPCGPGPGPGPRRPKPPAPPATIAGGGARSPGELPFTGSDLVMLALIGLGVAGSGLVAMALADRRRRQGAAA